MKKTTYSPDNYVSWENIYTDLPEALFGDKDDPYCGGIAYIVNTNGGPYFAAKGGYVIEGGGLSDARDDEVVEAIESADKNDGWFDCDLDDEIRVANIYKLFFMDGWRGLHMTEEWGAIKAWYDALREKCIAEYEEPLGWELEETFDI